MIGLSPQRFPVVRAAALMMAAMVLAGATVLLWKAGHRPFVIDDRHVDGTVFEGLQWLADNVGPVSDPIAEDALPRCVDKRQTRQIAELNAGLASLAQPMRVASAAALDCAQAAAANKAAAWLLRQRKDPSALLALLQSPGIWERELAQRDPFRLPGCLFIRGEERVGGGACAGEAGWREATPADWPPQAEGLAASLAFQRQALRGQVANVHKHEAAGLVTPLWEGGSQYLSLDSAVQAKAQVTAACYTGDLAACGRCPWCSRDGAATMYEGARARMLGVLVVDVRTGAIEAAASAHTACFAARHGGAAAAGCPELPGTATAQTWMLNNHVWQAAMPASLTKLITAAALLESDISPQTRAALPDWSARSDTEAFIDAALCADQGFAADCARHRAAAVQAMAAAAGWNAGCGGEGSCAKHELMSGGLLAQPRYAVPNGRFLLNLQTTALKLNPVASQDCYQSGAKQRWRGCQGEDLVNLIAEYYGQGNALASPVAIANLLLQLASAEVGQLYAPVAHLLAQVDGKAVRPAAKTAMRPETAQTMLVGMAQTHIRGTAQAACLQAAGRGGALACKEGGGGLRVAGKTGTPLFPADGKTLPEWRDLCDAVGRELAEPKLGQMRREHLRHQQARCGLSPYKWYATLAGPAGGGFEKAIVVLAERNWNQTTGRVDSVDDRGANVAAEAGLALLNAMYSPSDTRWRDDEKLYKSLAARHGKTAHSQRM